jgi:hypothetical protein
MIRINRVMMVSGTPETLLIDIVNGQGWGRNQPLPLFPARERNGGILP